jgi:hypothetical protein
MYGSFTNALSYSLELAGRSKPRDLRLGFETLKINAEIYR